MHGHNTVSITIVVGAHPDAERDDRAIAYGLQRALREIPSAGAAGRVDPAVCCDLWFLNTPELRDGPVISVGPPRVNALTAVLADRLRSAFVVDGECMVQLDVTFEDLACACWGADADGTRRAVAEFLAKYGAEYVKAAGGGE